MDSNLKTYIDSAREEGCSDSSIREKLIKSGWDAGVVDVALIRQQDSETTRHSTEPKQKFENKLAIAKDIITWSNKKKGVYWLTTPWVIFVPSMLLGILFQLVSRSLLSTTFYSNPYRGYVFATLNILESTFTLLAFISAIFIIIGIPIGIFFFIRSRMDKDTNNQENLSAQLGILVTSQKNRKRALIFLISPIFLWALIILVLVFISVVRPGILIKNSESYTFDGPIVELVLINMVTSLSIIAGVTSVILSIIAGAFVIKIKNVVVSTDFDKRSGEGAGSVVPDEIKGWNWGAAGLGWVWGLYHGILISLLAIVPFWWIVMGLKGNEWAWRKNHYVNIKEFKDSQSKWKKWGIVFFIFLSIAIVAISLKLLNTTRRVSRDIRRVQDIEHIQTALSKARKSVLGEDGVRKSYYPDQTVVIGRGNGEVTTLCASEDVVYWAGYGEDCGSDAVIMDMLPATRLSSGTSYQYYKTSSSEYVLLASFESDFGDFKTGMNCILPDNSLEEVWLCRQRIEN